ncbi:MAG: hypothetical protein ACLUOI_16870 [Eisenbergiella sp.]
MIPYTDIMKISDEETELLTGYEDLRPESLICQGVSCAVAGLGGESPAADQELTVRQGRPR